MDMEKEEMICISSFLHKCLGSNRSILSLGKVQKIKEMQ